MHAELVWIKSIAFSTCLMGVAWGRYQIPYLVSLGLAPSRIGLLRAAGLLAKFFAMPMWGAWADVHAQSTFPCVVAVLAVALLLEFYRSPAVVASFACLLALKMSRSAANGVGTLADVLTLRVMERHPGAGYGAQRLWTGVAWGCGSYVVGCLIDARGYGAIFSWTYVFSAATLVLLARGPAFDRRADGGKPAADRGVSAPGGASDEKSARGRGRTAANLWAYARGLDRSSDLRPFLCLMGLYGVAMSLVEALLFLQMAREFKSPKALMGAVTLVGTITEYPFFFKSDALIAQYGPVKMLKVAHACLALRLVGYAAVSATTAPVALPALQLLHGPCFALAWTAAVQFAADASTPSLRGTSQSVLSTAYYVVGAGVGSVFWSSIYEAGGSRPTYLLGAGLVALSGATFLPRLKARRADGPPAGSNAA